MTKRVDYMMFDNFTKLVLKSRYSLKLLGFNCLEIVCLSIKMMHLIETFQHLKIPLESIKLATNNFADKNCIGGGGFGKVYKGELVHSDIHTMVAFKRLDRKFGQGNSEFWKEIIMLSLHKHKNVVSLLGFCDESNEKILIYEYASNGSLDSYLANDVLTWIPRLEICIGAARGLAYLHNPGETQQRILHRDVKSSNILLDENWNARISDLGLSKFGPANQQYTFLMSNAVGTIGYCDPLYVETGLLTKESDVYSFGVVLFEVLCGRFSLGNNGDKRRPLTGLVRQYYEEDKISEILPARIKEEITPGSLKEFATIAYQCLMRDHTKRPLMTQVVSSLEKALQYQIQTLGGPKVDIFDAEVGFVRHKSPVIPDAFRCPISRELMIDPVIISSGQTYERSCIQKWLDAGHKVCPKTGLTLLHTSLTPNYVLKDLIASWCKSNGIDLSILEGNSQTILTERDQALIINGLLKKLIHGDLDDKRSAAGELRLLSNRNADSRKWIADSGGIPIFVQLLSSPDIRTREHAVTALLNLSIYEANKNIIVSVGAIPEIVEVLKNGSMEARENAAAALFSLSTVDENKVAIGAAGAITPLINLLQQGTLRGKKDASTALFNLCIYQGNKIKAIKAGIVNPLMRLVKDVDGGLIDESVALLALLTIHYEGQKAISQADPIPVLVEVVRTGSPNERENGVAILWNVCAGDIRFLEIMKQVEGLQGVLNELCENGTDRAKRKAGSLMELLVK